VKAENNLLLEELSFHAKFANGLLKVIQRKDPVIEDSFFSKASDEYKSSLEKVIEILNKLINDESDFIKNIFKEKYLELNQNCLINLTKLCSDLNYLKLYFNDIKNESIPKKRT